MTTWEREDDEIEINMWQKKSNVQSEKCCAEVVIMKSKERCVFGYTSSMCMDTWINDALWNIDKL